MKNEIIQEKTSNSENTRSKDVKVITQGILLSQAACNSVSCTNRPHIDNAGFTQTRARHTEGSS